MHTLLGKGVYSTVFKATDTFLDQAVAIKVSIVYTRVILHLLQRLGHLIVLLSGAQIMRNNPMMNAAGAKEASILAQLAASAAHDSSNVKTHIISLLHSFTFRNHFCMVVELFHCSLRRLIRKVGRQER